MNREEDPVVDLFGELTMDSVISHIENGYVFSALKLCHMYWENNVKFKMDLKNKNITGKPTTEQLKQILEENYVRWPVEVLLELNAFLNDAHKTPLLLILASEYGWKDGRKIEGTPIIGLEQTRNTIRDIISDKVRIHDGLFWKNAILDGDIRRFFEVIRNRPVLLVGPAYIKHFPTFAGLSNCRFIEVDGERAAWERFSILDKIRAAHGIFGNEKVICLIEAGGATSAWLISKLFPELKDSYFFALGQVLNICNYSVLENKNWFMVYRDKVCRTINSINPGWSSTQEAYGIDNEINKREISFNREIYTRGYNRDAYSLFRERQMLSNNLKQEKACSFIENKTVDYDLYHQLLEISAKENHWANFGPVSNLLEETLKQIMKVNQDKSVVVCKSATQAIHTLAGMLDIKSGKKLRWVTCAFGFFSTHIGPLTDIKIVDCNHQGMLDINALMQLDPDTWDAVIVTNIFGTCGDITPYTDYCKEHNKIIVMDNAMALLTETRTRPDAPCEAVSFHHTKPWGIGEGGCAVIDSEDVDLFRSLLNFGVNQDESTRPYCSNGKLSDFDSALILQRIINMPDWQRLYKLQARRIESILLKAGLKPLAEYPDNTIKGNLPFLAPCPVAKDALVNPWITFRKYYQPLTTGFPVADSVYARIINVPCHPQVADVAEQSIQQAIDKALGKEIPV